MEELFNGLFDFDSNRYFYHITSKGSGELIMEYGLGMAEKDYYTTMIEITPHMIEDPKSFLEEEYNPSGPFKREEMVIIGVPKEEVNSFIVFNNQELASWTEEGKPAYLVPSEKIMGYFDLEDEYYYSNYNYESIEVNELSK